MKSFIIRIQKLMTLEELEIKYNCPKNRIISLNKLCEDIYEGEWLYIESYEGVWYVVCPFDTIDSICKKFNIDKMTLKNLNQIEEIFLGQRLFIKK